MIKARSLQGTIFTSLLIAFATSCMPVHAAAPPAKERVFVGQLVSSTFFPVHNWKDDKPYDPKHPPQYVTINLNCAASRTTYTVLSPQGETNQRITASADLGEWCDLPAGMDGYPVLVDVVRQDGHWWVAHAYAFQRANDGHLVTTPSRDPVICGIRLWDLRSPLDPYNSRIDSGEEYPSQRNTMITQGILSKQADGSLIYASAIRMQDLFKALANSPCRLRPSDTD